MTNAAAAEELLIRPIDSYTFDELKAMAQDATSDYCRGPNAAALQARYRELYAAHEAELRKQLRPVNPRTFHPLGYGHQAYTVIAEPGTRKEDLTDPALWAVIPRAYLKPFTHITVIAGDEAFYAQVLVRGGSEDADPEFMLLGYWDLPPRAPLVANFLPKDYFVDGPDARGLYTAWWKRPSGERHNLNTELATRETARARCFDHAQMAAGRPVIHS